MRTTGSSPYLSLIHIFYDEALKIVGFDVNWLNKTLKEQNVKLEDIFIMTTDRAQNFQIVKKEAKE